MTYFENDLLTKYSWVKRARPFIYPIAKPTVYDYSNIKEITNNSAKVYFLGNNDFILTYYGGYQPIGYFNPYASWVFKKDLFLFLQKLLNDGYYLVCDNPTYIKDTFPELVYSIVKTKEGYTAVSK